MSKDYFIYLHDIIDQCDFLINNTKELTSEHDLLKNQVLLLAIERSLTIIGEASKKLPIHFRQQWSMVDWKSIAGMRDRLVHDYNGTDYEIIWVVITQKIKQLKHQIEHILSEHK